MKAYKLEILVVDHDEIGKLEIAKALVDCSNYPNACIMPDVMSIKSVDIGKWVEGHPLNSRLTMHEEFRRLFSKKTRMVDVDQKYAKALFRIKDIISTILDDSGSK